MTDQGYGFDKKKEESFPKEHDHCLYDLVDVAANESWETHGNNKQIVGESPWKPKDAVLKNINSQQRE